LFEDDLVLDDGAFGRDFGDLHQAYERDGFGIAEVLIGIKLLLDKLPELGFGGANGGCLDDAGELVRGAKRAGGGRPLSRLEEGDVLFRHTIGFGDV